MKLMHNCQRVSQVLLWQTKHSHSQSIWLHCQNHFQKSHPFHFLTQYIQRMRKHWCQMIELEILENLHVLSRLITKSNISNAVYLYVCMYTYVCMYVL
jgi:hypothetical protein